MLHFKRLPKPIEQLIVLYTRFSETFELKGLVQLFDQARAELDPYALLPDSYVWELRRHALVESVHYSTQIEGNTLTIAQVESLLQGGQVAASGREIQEVHNYREALSYIETVHMDTHQAVTEETIKTLHFLVSKGLDDSDYGPAQYRTQQNFVIDRISRRRLYLPPPPEQVPALMSELVQWLNSREPLHAAYRAGLAHLNFAAIHPFLDGNGRTARVLETLLMYRRGYRDVDLVSLEAYFGRDTQGYYEAIAQALGPRFAPPADTRAWLEYYLGAHVAQAQESIRSFKITSRQFDVLERELELDPIDAHILWLSCLHGQVTNLSARAAVHLSRAPTAGRLARLNERQLLIRHGRGRGVRYAPSAEVVELYIAAGAVDE